MKYFWTEEERKKHHTTACIEFQKGSYTGECWKADSLCLCGDIFSDTGLCKILQSALPDFDHYGITEVDKEQWEKIAALAERQGGKVAEAAAELTPWAEENFKTENVFTILGI